MKTHSASASSSVPNHALPQHQILRLSTWSTPASYWMRRFKGVGRIIFKP